jgi:hypothetical protein
VRRASGEALNVAISSISAAHAAALSTAPRPGNTLS